MGHSDWGPEKYKGVHALTHADLGDSLAAPSHSSASDDHAPDVMQLR